MQMLEWLLLAIGFSGTLTLVWLVRLVWARFRPPLSTDVHFSPHGGCTEVVVREVGLARREVLLLAYGFTSRPIAQALVEAKLRGVHVEVILDHSNESDPHSEMPHLVEQGLVPLIDDQHAIAHNKVILIDGLTVVTGSFNFTQHAETSNAENLLVLRHHPALVAIYRKDFYSHKDHARAVGGAKVGASGNTSHDRHGEPKPVEDKEITPRMTSAASDVLAKLRKQSGNVEEGEPKRHKAA